MSWDVVLMRVLPGTATATDLAEGAILPLGRRADVLRQLVSVLPSLDTTDPTWAVLDGPDFSIEFSLGPDDPVLRMMLHVRGSDAAIDPVRRVCEVSGWRAFDMSTGDFLDFEGNPLKGMHLWRSARDRLVTRLRSEGQDVQVDVRLKFGGGAPAMPSQRQNSPADLLCEQASEQLQAGQFDAAWGHLEKAITVDPGHARAFALRALVRQERNQHAHALTEWEQVVALAPELPWPHYFRGNCLAAVGQYADALTHYSRAIQLDDAEAEFYLDRGLAHVQLQHHEAAVEDFKRAAQLQPDNIDAYAYRSESLAHLERHAEVVATLNLALGLEPENSWLLAHRGAALRSLGRYDESLKDLNQALALNPFYGYPLGVRGDAYRLMGRLDEALADFDAYLKRDEDAAWGAAMRGETLRQMGRFEEARVDLERALAMSPDSGWTLASRGTLYRQINRYEESLADLDRAVTVGPRHAWAVAQRACTLRLMLRPHAALRDYNRAIELGYAPSWVRAERGATLRCLGQPVMALFDLSEALAEQPEDAWIRQERVAALRALGRYGEALADLDADVALGRVTVLVARAEVRTLLRQWRAALADLDAAPLKQDDWRDYLRSVCHRMLGDEVAARDALERATATARQAHAVRPADHRVTFNLALYRLAEGQTAEAKALYEAAIETGAAWAAIQAAAQDLADFAALFPEHSDALELRSYLERA